LIGRVFTYNTYVALVIVNVFTFTETTLLTNDT